MARKAPVTRQDLVELSRVGARPRTLVVLLAPAFLFAWVFVLFNFLDDLFGRFGPRSIVAVAAMSPFDPLAAYLGDEVGQRRRSSGAARAPRFRVPSVRLDATEWGARRPASNLRTS